MKLFVLAAGFACSCCMLTAQSADLTAQQRTTDPLLRFTNPDDRDPSVPVAEQEWNKKLAGSNRNNQPSLELPAPPKETQLAEGGTVSVRALKNPLSSKSLKLIEKAQDQIRKQDYVA